MAAKKRKEDFKVWLPPTHPGSQLKKKRKTKPTHPCSPRQALLSRSTSPRWLDPRQTSLTVVPRQLFLTCVQTWGCRLQRQRWCQQQGGGRRQRQWWQLGLRHKWWLKIFQLLEIAASLECLTATFSKKSFASLTLGPSCVYLCFNSQTHESFKLQTSLCCCCCCVSF